jgi:hypothetical protein
VGFGDPGGFWAKEPGLVRRAAGGGRAAARLQLRRHRPVLRVQRAGLRQLRLLGRRLHVLPPVRARLQHPRLQHLGGDIAHGHL